jgi:hypothetical protein
LNYLNLFLEKIYFIFNYIIQKCKNYEEEIKCAFKEDNLLYKQTKLKKKHITTSCLTYNNNIEDAFVTSKLGIQDMLIISVKINIKDYPLNSFTSGVHISLHTQTSNIDSGAGLIASPGQVTLIRLKKTINEYLNNTSIESFDGKISTIGDYNFEDNWGPKNETVVLAISYQDLNVMIIKELPPYDIMTFLSETGGVLGLLLGTSLVNLIVFLIQWAWGLKFNEYNWVNVQNREENNDKFNLPLPHTPIYDFINGNEKNTFRKDTKSDRINNSLEKDRENSLTSERIFYDKISLI